MSLTIQLIFNITKWYWLLNMSVLKYQIGVQAGVALGSGYWAIALFQWSGPFLSFLFFCVHCRKFHWIWQDSRSSFNLQMMLIHLRTRCGVNMKIVKQVSVIYCICYFSVIVNQSFILIKTAFRVLWHLSARTSQTAFLPSMHLLIITDNRFSIEIACRKQSYYSFL